MPDWGRNVNNLTNLPTSPITYSKEEICLSMKTFQLRESAACYNGISGIKNSDIGAKKFQDDSVARPQWDPAADVARYLGVKRMSVHEAVTRGKKLCAEYA